MNEESIMPFGSHKGKALKEIPESYWGWFVVHVARTAHNYKIHNYIREKYGVAQTNTHSEKLQISPDRENI